MVSHARRQVLATEEWSEDAEQFPHIHLGVAYLPVYIYSIHTVQPSSRIDNGINIRHLIY